MYAGAAVGLIFGIRELIRRIRIFLDGEVFVVRAFGHVHVYSAVMFLIIGILGMLVEPTLWLWMARACQRGRNWARITSTALFAIDTIAFALFVVEPGPDGVLWKLLTIASWVIGLLAVRLLWARASSGFFRPPHGLAVPGDNIPGADG